MHIVLCSAIMFAMYLLQAILYPSRKMRVILIIMLLATFGFNASNSSPKRTVKDANNGVSPHKPDATIPRPTPESPSHANTTPGGQAFAPFAGKRTVEGAGSCNFAGYMLKISQCGLLHAGAAVPPAAVPPAAIPPAAVPPAASGSNQGGWLVDS